MEEYKSHQITIIDSEGRELKATLHWDSNFDEWITVFKTILTWLTFSEELIKERFKEEDEEGK